MCGIVGAAAQRNVTGILIEGLNRLEYRGYDSAGLAVLDETGALQVRKNAGKVVGLIDKLASTPTGGTLGIAHTRWATHGIPNEANAHPHVSDDVAVVHNGIIENHNELRAELTGLGYDFVSDTDTEVVAHLIHHTLKTASSLKDAVQKTVSQLDGAYALGVICAREPEVLIGTRSGSPLVVGESATYLGLLCFLQWGHWCCFVCQQLNCSISTVPIPYVYLQRVDVILLLVVNERCEARQA